MSVTKIRERLASFRQTPESFAHELRLSLSEIVMEELREHGLSQRELAEKSGMKEPFITRVLSGDQNWTTETAGRVLHALAVRGRISRVLDSSKVDSGLTNRDEMSGLENPTWTLHATDGNQSAINLKDYSIGTTAKTNEWTSDETSENGSAKGPRGNIPEYAHVIGC